MSVFHILILSLVQAATEFLPVSSSGHLILLHRVLDGSGADSWGNSLIMDLAVHMGTLLAVLVYYRRDISGMIASIALLATRRAGTPENRERRHLALLLVVASLPVVIAGAVLEILEPQWLRSVYIVAVTLPLFGILLWWVDRISPDARDMRSMNLKDALMIGLTQMLALVPGVSRSGITMTTARWQNFSRVEAARFSFLLSTIATAGAGVMGGLALIKTQDMALAGQALLALVFTFFAALGVIHWLMKFLERSTFKAFGIYRIFLGGVLIALIYLGVLV